MSELTKQQAPDFKYLLVDKVNVVGKNEPVLIYTILKNNVNIKDEYFDAFHVGQKQFFNKRFELPNS